ncbi:hypothetical protein [Sphingomonas natans]|uniref:hypothetical protein n=1 Tax=Sphingomonas natans TaxID=3063330 RepID=UPI003D671D97
MSRQFVEDDDVASFQRRRKFGFDELFKDGLRHRPIDDPGGSEATVAEPGDAGLRLLMSERCPSLQACSEVLGRAGV